MVMGLFFVLRLFLVEREIAACCKQLDTVAVLVWHLLCSAETSASLATVGVSEAPLATVVSLRLLLNCCQIPGVFLVVTQPHFANTFLKSFVCIAAGFGDKHLGTLAPRLVSDYGWWSLWENSDAEAERMIVSYLTCLLNSLPSVWLGTQQMSSWP